MPPSLDDGSYKDPLIDAFVAYVAAHSFTTSIDSFFLRHCRTFESLHAALSQHRPRQLSLTLASGSTRGAIIGPAASDDTPSFEHPLIFTEIFLSFEDLVQTHLKKFCSSNHVSVSELIDSLKVGSSRSVKVRHYTQVLLSSLEYSSFVTLMAKMFSIHGPRLNREERRASTSSPTRCFSPPLSPSSDDLPSHDFKSCPLSPPSGRASPNSRAVHDERFPNASLEAASKFDCGGFEQSEDRPGHRRARTASQRESKDMEAGSEEKARAVGGKTRQGAEGKVDSDDVGESK